MNHRHPANQNSNSTKNGIERSIPWLVAGSLSLANGHSLGRAVSIFESRNQDGELRYFKTKTGLTSTVTDFYKRAVIMDGFQRVF